MVFELTTLEAIGTDCTGSGKSNYFRVNSKKTRQFEVGCSVLLFSFLVYIIENIVTTMLHNTQINNHK